MLNEMKKTAAEKVGAKLWEEPASPTLPLDPGVANLASYRKRRQRKLG